MTEQDWWLSKADRQRSWRHNSGLVQLSLNLEPETVALLDAMAIDLYRKHPHRPPNTLAQTTPSRAQAVRVLVQRYADNRERRGKPAPIRKLLKLQRALGAFWRREAVWRRNKTGLHAGSKQPKDAPTPPWHGVL